MENSALFLEGEVCDNGLRFGAYVTIETDGTRTIQESQVVVQGATWARILFAGATDYAQNASQNYRRMVDLKKELSSICSRAKTLTYEDLKKRHVADYQELFSRVSLSLETGTDSILIRELLESKDPQTKLYLEELFFHYNRYLAICSSRPGFQALPSNLQGVWNAVDNPPWNGDYHLNINLQMNYWPLCPANLASLTEPLLDFVDDLRHYGRYAAKAYAGIETSAQRQAGWMVHTQATPFGWTAPGWDFYWGWSPIANAWLTSTLFDCYRFTKDETLLRERIYPILKETVLFWLAFLVEDRRSQRLVSSPSFSPEHGPLTIGNTFDQSLIWQVFRAFLQAAAVLDLDKKLFDDVSQKIGQLKPLQINARGMIQEWYEEEEEDFDSSRVEKGHRHVSHLVGLFPGTLFSETEEMYASAAKESLLNRGDGGTGWATAHKMNLWARLLDGNKAHQLLRKQLQEFTLPNLWCTHPPFQIDGNFGALSGMLELLLQSHQGFLALLPALPDAWDKGRVAGVLARGNFLVELDWEHSRLREFTICSQKGGDLVIEYPGIEFAKIRRNGIFERIRLVAKNRISLDTKEGDVIQADFRG